MSAFIAHYREADSPPALTSNNGSELEKKGNDFEAGYTLDDNKGGSKQASASDENAMAQLIAVAVLEFGIILHRHVLMRPMSTTRRELTEAYFQRFDRTHLIYGQ